MNTSLFSSHENTFKISKRAPAADVYGGCEGVFIPGVPMRGPKEL